MDPAPDPLAASAPFPTIPAAAPSPRPRVAKPRRQAAAFRSDHPVASSPSRRPGGDFPSFALGGAAGAGSQTSTAGAGSQPSTAGAGTAGSRPAAFVFGGAAASSRGVDEGSSSASSWSSYSDAKFVFSSGVSGASEVKRSFSFGSGDASLSSISATVEELILDDSSGKQSDANAYVSRGNDSVLEMNAGDSFCACESSLNLHEFFCPSILHGETEQLDEGRGVQSQTIGCEITETSSSLAGLVVYSTICTDKNVSTEFAKDGSNSSVGDSVDEGDFTKDGSKVSANGGDVEQKLFVFGKCASSGHRRFAANVARSDIKKVDSADKDNVTYSSEQLDPSASEDSACTKLQPAHDSSNRDPPHLGPLEIPETEKASNAAHFNFGSQYDSAKVSFAKLPDGTETQRTVVAESVLGKCGSFDDKSFTVHEHNAACQVKPKKFSSACQVSSLQTVFTSDSFSGKVAPEINLHLKEIVNFGLVGSGICIGNCRPEEADATHDNSAVVSLPSCENYVFIGDPAQERHSWRNAMVNSGGYSGFRLHLSGDEDTPAVSTSTSGNVLPSSLHLSSENDVQLSSDQALTNHEPQREINNFECGSFRVFEIDTVDASAAVFILIYQGNLTAIWPKKAVRCDTTHLISRMFQAVQFQYCHVIGLIRPWDPGVQRYIWTYVVTLMLKNCCCRLLHHQLEDKLGFQGRVMSCTVMSRESNG